MEQTTFRVTKGFHQATVILKVVRGSYSFHGWKSTGDKAAGGWGDNSNNNTCMARADNCSETPLGSSRQKQATVWAFSQRGKPIVPSGDAVYVTIYHQPSLGRHGRRSQDRDSQRMFGGWSRPDWTLKRGDGAHLAWAPAAVEPKQLAVVRLWSTWSLDPHAAADLSARSSRWALGQSRRG